MRTGQSAYWYSQGCFIGCPTCDHESGRRQTDLCKKGFVGKLPTEAIAVNRHAERDSKYDIYRHNPWVSAITTRVLHRVLLTRYNSRAWLS